MRADGCSYRRIERLGNVYEKRRNKETKKPLTNTTACLYPSINTGGQMGKVQK